MANEIQVTTTISNEVCKDCKNIYDVEIHLKKLSYKYHYEYTKVISIPGKTNEDGTTSPDTSVTVNINLDIPIDIYQCPSCKTIYDSELHLTTSEENAKSKYSNYMKKFGLERRGE